MQCFHSIGSHTLPKTKLDLSGTEGTNLGVWLKTTGSRVRVRESLETTSRSDSEPYGITIDDEWVPSTNRYVKLPLPQPK